MITTGMLKRRLWMADDDEFEHIIKKLNDQYENHTYVEEITKECNVMFVSGTYVLEAEVDTKFSLGDIWNLSQGDTLPNNARNFYRQMISCMKAYNYLQKTLDLPLNTEIIRQAHGLMMENEKDVLAREYRKSPAFVGYHIFAPAGHIERYMEDAILKFYETKKDDPMMVATNLFGNIINTHPFEDGNGRICHLILAHDTDEMLSISSHFKLFS